MQETDDGFYSRADEHIHLANDQIKEEISRGKVSASFMYSVSRFNSWVSACGYENAQEMENAKDKTIEYFVADYKKMLEENLDDYISNFNAYMKKEGESV